MSKGTFDKNITTTEVEIAAVLAQASSFRSVAPRFLQDTCEAFGWQLGEVWVLDIPLGLMRWHSIWHTPDIDATAWLDLAADNAVRPGLGILGRVWSSGSATWIDDLGTDDDFFRRDEASSIGLRSACGIPLSFGNRVDGVALFFGRRLRKPDPVMLRSLESLGREAGRLLSIEIAETIGEQHLRNLIDHADDILAVIALDGTIVYESESVERVLGYSRRQRIGTRVFDYIHPDDLGRTFEAIRTAVQEPGSPQRLEVRARARSGEWVWLESIGSIHAQGAEQPIIVAVSRDVSVRKRQEEALENAGQLLRTTVNSSPVILYQLNRDGVYELNEGGALTSVGRQPGEAVGKPISEVYADVPEIPRLAALALEGESVSTEAFIRGTWFRATLEPILDAEGHVVGCSGLAVDISELKEAQWILEHQGRLMETVALSEPLNVVLLELAEFLEEAIGRVACAIWIVEEGAIQLTTAAPNVQGPIETALAERSAELRSGTALTSTYWFERPEVLRGLGYSLAETVPLTCATGTPVGGIELFSHATREPRPTDDAVLGIAQRVIQVALLRSTPNASADGTGRPRGIDPLPLSRPAVKRVKAGQAARSELGITDGELIVLRLVAEGLSNKEIARSLSLSPHTVKDYLSSSLGKLKVKNRAEAVMVASRRRLI